jgi:hypothetical protein
MHLAQRVPTGMQISREDAHIVATSAIRAPAARRFTRERSLVRNQPRPCSRAHRPVEALRARRIVPATGPMAPFQEGSQLACKKRVVAWTHEKAHGCDRGPFHPANVRKVQENADDARHAEIDEKPCKDAGLRISATRLKIVVSPVRVRVSPLTKAPANRSVLGLFGGPRKRMNSGTRTGHAAQPVV